MIIKTEGGERGQQPLFIRLPHIYVIPRNPSSPSNLFIVIPWQQRELLEIGWYQNNPIVECISDNEKIDFWIFGFLDFFFCWISGYISGTKRATEDPLVFLIGPGA